MDKNQFIQNGKATKRHYGFIADDFHELGLTEVVQYGSDGQVEGLAYDRISMYHNVILQDHEKEISALKITVNFDIWQLKNEIKELKNEINRLTQAVA